MADLRNLLDTVLDELADDAESREQIRAFVKEAFTLEKEKRVWESVTCKHCRRTGQYQITVTIPDYRERAKAIEILMDQAKGKPNQPVTVGGSLVLRALSGEGDINKVSNAELASFVESQMSEQERKELEEAVETGDLEKQKALGFPNLSAMSSEELRQIASGEKSVTDFTGNGEP